MGSSYYQFCPVSKAMELLDERWTMLVVRELVCGSQRFNDLRRGLPRRMVEVWRGDRSWTDALRQGDLQLHGPEQLRRALPGWFTSRFANIPRPLRNETVPT